MSRNDEPSVPIEIEIRNDFFIRLRQKRCMLQGLLLYQRNEARADAINLKQN